jgi:hypothetical protein
MNCALGLAARGGLEIVMGNFIEGGVVDVPVNEIEGTGDTFVEPKPSLPRSPTLRWRRSYRHVSSLSNRNRV